VLAAFADGSGLEVFAEWQRDQVGWNRLRTDYTDRLATIDTPTLLVHGDHDTGVPLARVEAAAEKLPHGRLVVAKDAGHWVQRDRPDIVLPALRDHLERAAHA
jgi:pimeloyl-ACP methyl ester carboxylesterase